ncbi:MAG: integrase [Gammaproteobacteria bacterium RIFCSPHIGHO2_12_FULL_41_15]|nr:MAG: integrase [Gammaproteobacteria bacterium RIFCSPHIGHO2_12_FULL_41_15]
MTTTECLLPIALFDTMDHLEPPADYQFYHRYSPTDIQQAVNFLQSYKGSLGTFNSYRREIERLLHWCSLVAHQSLQALKRTDIEAFIAFCQRPPKQWIGLQKLPRFIDKDGVRVPNPAWRPFVVTVSKIKYRRGETPQLKNFELSQGALKELFAILSSFYNYLLQEEYVTMNPVALIRQKSKYVRKAQGQPKIRRLTDLQWQYVIKTAQTLADQNPIQHERTLFILSALYSMYLRISELTANDRWQPKMNDFSRDSDQHWWFTTVGKGNKQRQIAVSDAMLEALKRWRKHWQLSPLPSPADHSPLLPRSKGKGSIKSTNYIRKIVQFGFDQAMEQLHHDGFSDEAEALAEATVHWLRHTGISDDVKHRPREHVRDDAGHSSSAITDKYIDIERRERHQSAKKKRIVEDELPQ